MLDTRFIEAWHRMMAEAMRSTTELREGPASRGKEVVPSSPSTFLRQIPTSPEDFMKWMMRFVPGEQAAASAGETGDEWAERWYKTMGVVPRARYLELLERYEVLRKRLEDTEERLKRLRGMSQTEGVSGDAKQFLETWNKTLEDTLRAQSEWMQSFARKPGATTGNPGAGEPAPAAVEPAPSARPDDA